MSSLRDESDCRGTRSRTDLDALGMIRLMETRRSAVISALLGLLLVGAACGRGPSSIDEGLFFPTTKVKQGRGGAVMTAAYTGPLVVRDGCVLIGPSGQYSIPIWWKGFSADRDASGHVVVRDGDGATVAIEGQEFTMGGGFTAEFEPADKVEPRLTQLERGEKWLGYPIPQRCLTPEVYGVWVVGDTHALSNG
jgi:hypothetical protein